MELNIISYSDLLDPSNTTAAKNLETALLQQGIVGISHVPEFEKKSRAYVQAARAFSALPDSAKQQYAPVRDAGDTEGYEVGAEWFKTKEGAWKVDDKKVSYYAFVPDKPQNKWPKEVDLKTPYLALGELIFKTGKILLNVIGLNASVGLEHEGFTGYGRMLHYLKENDLTNENPDWCGGHFDHGIFTGLMPAYYFRDGIEVDEPEEAGLYIVPTGSEQYEKVAACDKSIMMFQVGEFGQLASNDRIKATRHIVRKAQGGIERYAFALFYNADESAVIKAHSVLTEDDRYKLNKRPDGSITYGAWHYATFDLYRAK